MALWDLGAVMSQATSVIGNRYDITASVASLYANQAALDVQLAVEPLQLEGLAVSSTTSGENKITLPSDFYSIINVSNLSTSPSFPITAWNSNDIDAATAFPSGGAPVAYVLYGTWMELWPSPNSSYSIQLRYQTRQNVLEALTDLPSFDTRFGSAWMHRTAFYLANSVKDYETAAWQNQLFMSQIASIPSDLALRQRDRSGAHITFKWGGVGDGWSGTDFDHSSWGPRGPYGP